MNVGYFNYALDQLLFCQTIYPLRNFKVFRLLLCHEKHDLNLKVLLQIPFYVILWKKKTASFQPKIKVLSFFQIFRKIWTVWAYKHYNTQKRKEKKKLIKLCTQVYRVTKKSKMNFLVLLIHTTSSDWLMYFVLCREFYLICRGAATARCNNRINQSSHQRDVLYLSLYLPLHSKDILYVLILVDYVILWARRLL